MRCKANPFASGRPPGLRTPSPTFVGRVAIILTDLTGNLGRLGGLRPGQTRNKRGGYRCPQCKEKVKSEALDNLDGCVDARRACGHKFHVAASKVVATRTTKNVAVDALNASKRLNQKQQMGAWMLVACVGTNSMSQMDKFSGEEIPPAISSGAGAGRRGRSGRCMSEKAVDRWERRGKAEVRS